jgi:hypothetical protein
MIDEFRRRGYFSDEALSFFTRRPLEEIAQAKWQERFAYYRDRINSGATYDDIIGPHFWGPLPPEQIPSFTPQADHPDFVTALNRSAMFAAATLVVFILGFVAFLRYDVR